MAIYKGSRYVGSKVAVDEGIKSIGFRRKGKYGAEPDDRVIRFKRGMRLDSLAKKIYGDPQLEWIILEANPQYYSPYEVSPGDFLVIPDPNRVDE